MVEAAKKLVSGDRAVPRHVAIIMDGNGRWAKRRAMPRQAGHRAGVKPVRSTVEYCARASVEVLTLFAFSSENWRRPREEVSTLMGLFVNALDREIDELHANGVRLKFVGDLPALSSSVNERIQAAEERTRENEGMKLVVAVAYGGRWDLAQAAKTLADRVASGEIEPKDINEEIFGAELALSDLPEVDLLIRTGGERRLSNFLLWDLAYAELYFSDVLWPDFRDADLQLALDAFAQRERRFGRTSAQVAPA